MALSSGSPGPVSIQMQKSGKGNWTTIQTVKVAKRTGDFDIHTKLPYSGNLRLAYTYPQTETLLPPNVAGSTIVGRTVKVTVRLTSVRVRARDDLARTGRRLCGPCRRRVLTCRHS